MELFKACAMWRKMVGLRQCDIYGEKKVNLISAFENGRSANIKHFEWYLGLAVAMGKKAEFDYCVQYYIDRHINKGGMELKPTEFLQGDK